MIGPARSDQIALYAVAQLGTFLAFIPLFVLLLPRRVLAVAGADAASWLSATLLAGGIAASVGHVVAGRLSDGWMRRHGNRRAPIALGTAATAVSLAALGFADRPWLVLIALVVFQLSLNLLFAPLNSLLPDHIDDRSRGRVAAVAALALPFANLSTSAFALGFPQDGVAGFLLSACLTVALVSPLLVVWPFAAKTHDDAARQTATVPAMRWTAGQETATDFRRAWIARLLVQMGAAFVINYFYLYLTEAPTIAPAHRAATVSNLIGQLALLSAIAVLVTTMAAAHWSDRAKQRRLPMALAAACCAAALLAMTASSNWATIAIGYVMFQIGLTCFLALDMALVAKLIEAEPRRGELLGYMNLTNTIPSIAVSSLALMELTFRTTIPWTAYFLAMAGFAAAASLLILRIRSVG